LRTLTTKVNKNKRRVIKVVYTDYDIGLHLSDLAQRILYRLDPSNNVNLKEYYMKRRDHLYLVAIVERLQDMTGISLRIKELELGLAETFTIYVDDHGYEHVKVKLCITEPYIYTDVKDPQEINRIIDEVLEERTNNITISQYLYGKAIIARVLNS
jgi:hypothetical protein